MSKPRFGQRPWWFSSNVLAMLLVGGAMAVSMYRVLSIEREVYDPDRIVIRITHWQLELGFRGGLETVIDAYEQLHPGVDIVQLPVSERVYGPTLNTHLLAGTAPDIAEIGMSQLASQDETMARFYIPLGDEIDAPNPYNRGTDLENVAWRNTFIDGMRGGFREKLQDFFVAPTSIHSVRMFYNSDLLERATGSPDAPASFGKLMETCDRLRNLGAREGRTIVPIAGSSYSFGIFQSMYLVPFTSSYESKLDLDLDGGIGGRETYIGLLNGAWSMDDPSLRCYFDQQRQLAAQFSPGFLAMGREQAAFLFVQGRAGFIVTGSWDATSLIRQARRFKIGICDLPMPAPDEPGGQYVSGRINEAATSAGGGFGVYKLSRHRERAVDFLKFLTSVKYNGMLNTVAGWPPATIGAVIEPHLRAFMPSPVGFSARLNMRYGAHITARVDGELKAFVLGEIEYDELARNVHTAFMDPRYGADHAWSMDADAAQRHARDLERVLAVQHVRGVMRGEPDASAKYDRALSAQIRLNNGRNIRHQFRQVRGKTLPRL